MFPVSNIIMIEKQAIITLNYGYETNIWYKYMRKVFIPSIRNYSKRIHADFILMNDNNDRYFHTWNQLQLLEYLDYYDRVMYIDGDCYIPKTFRYNFFNVVPHDNIGLFENTEPIEHQCNLVFIVMLLSKINRIYFTPPPVNEQKYKRTGKYNYCSFGKPLEFACYGREECYINECINKYNIKYKIKYLSYLKNDNEQTFLSNYNISKFKLNNIFHINLNTKIIIERENKFK